MAQVNLTLDSEILKGMFTAEGRDEAFSGLLRVILNQVLNAQASEQAGAGLYERSDSRCTYRNGCRERELYTRVEKLRLMGALLRSCQDVVGGQATEEDRRPCKAWYNGLLLPRVRIGIPAQAVFRLAAVVFFRLFLNVAETANSFTSLDLALSCPDFLLSLNCA